jgi:hypothetical protein
MEISNTKEVGTANRVTIMTIMVNNKTTIGAAPDT